MPSTSAGFPSLSASSVCLVLPSDGGCLSLDSSFALGSFSGGGFLLFPSGGGFPLFPSVDRLLSLLLAALVVRFTLLFFLDWVAGASFVSQMPCMITFLC